MVTESECWDQGGEFVWEGVECEGDDNGDGVDDLCDGACCYTDSYCTVLCVNTTETNCLAVGGWYQGDGSECLGDYNQNGSDDVCEPLPCCCQGRVGDANGEGGDEPTIGDVAVIIDALFITGSPEPLGCCLEEADVNLSAQEPPGVQFADITIGDVSILIDYLFITGPSLGLADCPCSR